MRLNLIEPGRRAPVGATDAGHTRGATEAMAPLRAQIEREFPSLRDQHGRILHLALNEAEALAWQTGFPELVFPVLAREKVSNLAAWRNRQHFIRWGIPTSPPPVACRRSAWTTQGTACRSAVRQRGLLPGRSHPAF